MGEIQLSDIAALLGNRNDNNGFGGDDGLLLLVIILLFGGWGRGGWGNQGAGGYGAGGVGGNELYPWLNQTEVVNSGFRDQMLNSGITGLQQSVTAGFGGVEQSLCAGFAGVNAGISNGFSQAEIAANARQMADMQQAFNAQVAMMQGFNGVQAQQAQCCCDNQLAMANQTATILAEHCSDRAALSDGVRDIIAANQAGTQRIIDQLCQDKIDEKNDQIAMLRQQVQMQNLAASQAAQTAQILADNFAQTNALEQYLAPVPRPAYIVQNPNCCQQNYGCGCGYAA